MSDPVLRIAAAMGALPVLRTLAVLRTPSAMEGRP